MPPLDSGDGREKGSRARAVLGKIATHLEYLEYLEYLKYLENLEYLKYLEYLEYLKRVRVCEC